MNVLLVAGFPRSGKTTYLRKLQENGWSVFDDFKAGANSLAFRKSAKFEKLPLTLRGGARCVVADIDFCLSVSRAEAKGVVLDEAPGVEIRWLFFENDEQACEENIRRRSRDSLETDLAKLREYSRLYEIPAGALVLPVRK